MMTEPSVEEIVAGFEVGMNGRRIDSFNTIFSPQLRALIADWRKRGEALAEARRDMRDVARIVRDLPDQRPVAWLKVAIAKVDDALKGNGEGK
jgi:hypothetical protein